MHAGPMKCPVCGEKCYALGTVAGRDVYQCREPSCFARFRHGMGAKIVTHLHGAELPVPVTAEGTLRL